MPIPRDAGTLAVGALRCADAPRVEPEGTFVAPDRDGTYFVRVRVPAHSAVGFLANLDRAGATVCTTCDAFDQLEAPSACRNDDVGPVRGDLGLDGTTYYSFTGRPLAVNTTDADAEVVLALGPSDAAMSLVRFELAASSAEPTPCVAERIASGVAYPSTRSCGIELELPPSSAALLFGTPGQVLLENVTAVPAIRGRSTGGAPAAALTITSEGVRCDDPITLMPGTSLVLRADLGGSMSELCAVPTPLLGARYLDVVIPPQSRGVVHASSRFIADGGGYAMVAVASACDAARSCDSITEQPWIADGPPLEHALDNATDEPMHATLSVHQGGVGYRGNEITVSLVVEAL